MNEMKESHGCSSSHAFAIMILPMDPASKTMSARPHPSTISKGQLVWSNERHAQLPPKYNLIRGWAVDPIPPETVSCHAHATTKTR